MFYSRGFDAIVADLEPVLPDGTMTIEHGDQWILRIDEVEGRGPTLAAALRALTAALSERRRPGSQPSSRASSRHPAGR